MPFHVSGPVIAIMIGFVVVSAVMGSALAAGGGWRKAAEQFVGPSELPPGATRFRFASLRMTGGMLGVATYSSCVTVGLSDRGIWLSLWGPFGLFHPPLLIPWTAVEDCHTVPALWGHLTHVTLRGGGGFRAWPPVAAALMTWWERKGRAGHAA